MEGTSLPAFEQDLRQGSSGLASASANFISQRTLNHFSTALKKSSSGTAALIATPAALTSRAPIALEAAERSLARVTESVEEERGKVASLISSLVIENSRLEALKGEEKRVTASQLRLEQAASELEATLSPLEDKVHSLTQELSLLATERAALEEKLLPPPSASTKALQAASYYKGLHELLENLAGTY